MKKMKTGLIVLAVLLALGLGAMAGGYYWYRQNHVKVNGTVYDIHVAEVDLRGQTTTARQYEDLRAALPDAVIRWNVPFQDAVLPDDTQELTVDRMTPEDVDQLRYFPKLTLIKAPQCRDYEALTELEQRYPDCRVEFEIHIGEQSLPRDTASLNLGAGEGTAQELQAAFQYLPGLSQVELTDPAIPASELYALQEAYPNVTMTWTKDFMGKTYSMEETMLDLSETKPESVEAVEAFAAYFPNLEQLDMVECGFENEEMAAFRDRVRDQYKVVWGVQVGKAYLRTDVTHFMPGQMNKRVRNEDTYNLRYCEDLIAVDFGHIGVSNLEWVVGTPHIKYLILGDGNVFNQDIVPIGTLKELEWLEIFNSPVTDVSPLVGCTSLKDLLLSGSYIDVTPLGEMPWLENIWMLHSGVDGKDITYLHEHLPNTHLEVNDSKDAHSHGWRHLPRYFEMRDAFEMWYMEG